MQLLAMQNVSELCNVWPSDADLARDLGVPYPTVAAWKQRGSIPASYWRRLLRAAKARRLTQVTADLLIDLHARKPIGTSEPGFAEEETAPFVSSKAANGTAKDVAKPAAGHFSRFKHLRRMHFRSAEEIEDHIRALRDEWSHR
jgi:hypothetical protein